MQAAYYKAESAGKGWIVSVKLFCSRRIEEQISPSVMRAHQA